MRLGCAVESFEVEALENVEIYSGDDHSTFEISRTTSFGPRGSLAGRGMRRGLTRSGVDGRI